jgi:two-component system OmpR family sensor kinase
VSFVVVLLTLVGVLGIALFAHEVNTAIGLSQSSAQAYAERAAQSRQPFLAAAVDFETHDTHEGVHTYAGLPRIPRAGGPRPPELGPPPGPPPQRAPAGFLPPPDVAVVDGVVRHGPGLRARFEGSRLGYAIATLFGVRVPQPQPFLNGVIAFGPDPALFQNIALGVFAAIVLAALAVGLCAYLIGRFITQQAIQPLVDVTEALQRFAARDFRSQAIALAGKSDFDVLAHAYNAAAEQVAAAFAEREAAEAQMRQFVADAGHELRTPLTIVLGYIDLLRRRASASDERSKFIFTSIAAEGRRMRTLVDNLVLLARLEGDEARLIDPFDVTELIAEIVELRRGLAPGVAFVVHTPVAALAIADRRDVYEAVANIVDNAIKYAPGSPIAITTSMPNDASVEIAIADEGPGIPPEDRDAIFERFYRGALRGEVEGSGLGLAIAKRAVEKAGGTLRLDTAVERGTRFAIVLRAERAQPVSEETPSLRPVSTISRMRG